MGIKPLKIIGAVGSLLSGGTTFIGSQVRNLGIGLLGGAATTAAVSSQLPVGGDVWTDRLNVVLQILTLIQAIVGLIMTGAGQAQNDQSGDADTK